MATGEDAHDEEHLDVLEHARDLHSNPGPNVRDQHVVSRVLLKRFAAGNKVMSYRISTGTARPTGLSKAGTIPDFVGVDSLATERLWGRIENRIDAAFSCLDAGDLFKHPQYVRDLKDFLALHFVRSPQLRLKSHMIWADVLKEIRAKAIVEQAGPLARLYQARTGLIPNGPGALERAFDLVARPTNDLLSSGAYYRATAEQQLGNVQRFIEPFNLEIGEAENGEFLIGDSPTLTWRPSAQLPGVLGGTAIGDAEMVFMPLGPRHVMALTTDEARWRKLDVTTVRACNEQQVLGSVDRVFFRPGNECAAEVARLRPPTRR